MTPHYEGEGVTLHHGDCLAVMATLPANSVDAIVTDPPYGLGFMGKAWDALPPGEEWAAECLRVLKPGGHLLAFGGTRTWHRLAVAVEDAGFEMRDSIAWLYGSGFPKSLDVSKAIDKAAGAEREVIGTGTSFGAGSLRNRSRVEQGYRPTELNPAGGAASITAPATDAAQQWGGWGTALKPGHEPVVWGVKPLGHNDYCARIGSHLDQLEQQWQALEADRTTLTGEAAGSSAATDTSASASTAETFSNTVTSWKACLVELSERPSTSTTETTSATTTVLETLWSSILSLTPTNMLRPVTSPPGLTPIASAVDNLFASAVFVSRATLAHSATESATGSTHTAPPAAAGSPGFEPIVVARKPLAGTVAANVLEHGTGALNIDGCRIGTGDALGRPYGGDNTVYGKYSMDRGRWPANVILDEHQAAALDQQSGTRTSGKLLPHHADNGKKAGTLGQFTGAPGRESFGDSGGASRFFYVAKAPAADRPRDGNVTHPTVKPIDLMQWLVRLVTPPGGTVLDPFAGSGTTGEAAIREGFSTILIEREADYLPLILERFTRPINYIFDFGGDA